MVVIAFQALVLFGFIFYGNYPVMEFKLLRKQDFLLNVVSGTTPVHGSFLQKSCESVSFSLNSLSVIFSQKESNVCYIVQY